MEIEFDSEKDRRNIAKHGVSLALAADLEWDRMMCREDHRENYGEFRLQCFAPIADRLYCLICTENDDNYRAISLREATPQEIKHYVYQRHHR